MKIPSEPKAYIKLFEAVTGSSPSLLAQVVMDQDPTRLRKIRQHNQSLRKKSRELRSKYKLSVEKIKSCAAKKLAKTKNQMSGYRLSAINANKVAIKATKKAATTRNRLQSVTQQLKEFQEEAKLMSADFKQILNDTAAEIKAPLQKQIKSLQQSVRRLIEQEARLTDLKSNLLQEVGSLRENMLIEATTARHAWRLKTQIKQLTRKLTAKTKTVKNLKSKVRYGCAFSTVLLGLISICFLR